MLENHTELYTANICRLSSTGARVGLSTKYWVTPFGSLERCGTRDPGTAASARSRSRNSAVRMLDSWRQNQRSQPTTPSFGWVMDAASPPRADSGAGLGES